MHRNNDRKNMRLGGVLDVLGRSWRCLGVSWRCLGGVLEVSWGVWEGSWRIFMEKHCKTNENQRFFQVFSDSGGWPGSGVHDSGVPAAGTRKLTFSSKVITIIKIMFR